MSSSIRLILAGLLLLTCTQAGWAQNLLQVYREAVEGDPQIKESDAQRQANQELKPQARALLLPDFRASGTVDRRFGVDGNRRTKSSFSAQDVTVSLVQPLFDQSARVQVRQAEAIVNQSEAEYIVAVQDLILRTAQRYFDVLAAQDTLTFVTADKEAIGRQLEQANRRFEVGLITITDVLEAQARFDLAVADEIRARNGLADAVEALRELTGIVYESDELFVVNEEAPFDPPDPADPELWVREALRNNPRILSAAFAVESARENINLQKAGHYPTLDLVGTYFNNEVGDLDESGNSIGLQLNVPFYQGGAVVARTREAAYQHEAAKQRLENEQRAVIRQVRDSFRGLVASTSRIKALDRARVSNESGLEATQAGFEVGTRTIVDVLDAQRDLFEARRNYSVERYSYIINYLSLRQGAGVVDVTDLEAINRWLQPPTLPSSEADVTVPGLPPQQ